MISQESTEKGRHRITLAALSERLKIPLRTLFRYRRDHPEQAPKSFDDLEAWIEFIGKIRNYSAERTRPRDRNGTEPSVEDQKGEYAEFSPGAERRERVIKLRLGNEVAARRWNGCAEARSRLLSAWRQWTALKALWVPIYLGCLQI